MVQVDAALKEEARQLLMRTQEEMTAALPERFELRKMCERLRQPSKAHCGANVYVMLLRPG
jgi:hypothetical protein